MRTKRDENKYVVEVVVAIDQTMMDYYGNDVENVVMSIISAASNVYENSNLKQSVSISLSDIIRMPFDPTEGADMPGTDGGMCKIFKI